MSVRIEQDEIFLYGRCPAEDAEALLIALQDRPDAIVDVTDVQKLHMAVLQILLGLRPAMRGCAVSPFLSRNIFARLIWANDSAANLS